MPADANIFAQYLKAPKSAMDYQADYDQAETRKNALQLAAMDLSEKTQANQRLQQVRAALMGLGPTATDEQRVSALRATATPEGFSQADALEKALMERQRTGAQVKRDTSQAGHFDAQTEQVRAKQAAEMVGHLGDAISALQTLPGVTPAHVAATIQNAGKMYGIPDDMVQKAIAQVPQDPAQLPTFLQAKTKELMTAKERMSYIAPDANAVLSSNTSRANNADTNATHVKTTAMTNATSRANNAATIQKDYTVAGIKPDGTPMEVGGAGPLSQEAIINAATRYNMDGTLPPNMGRGAQGARQTSAILNEAARQAAARGDSPEAQRIAQLANKASAQAMGQLEKQATMVGAFEKNFNKNADIALELSQKVDRTGVPILNKWINAGKRSIAGDPDISAFDASVKATVNEYAKIVSGSTGSAATAEGEIKKIEGLLNAAQTPQQVASVLSLMKRETQNRMSGFEEQRQELRSSMIRPGSARPAHAAPAGLPSQSAIDAELARRGKK